MKEIDFKDRIPTYPGRVELLKVEGKENTFDLKRADEPTEEGTPIDKAAFESIIQSRLTGRFYIPTVSRAPHTTRTDLTANLLSGTWVVDAEDNNKAVNGIFSAESESNNGSAWTVDEAFSASGWQSMGGDYTWIKISHPTSVKVRNIRFAVEFQYSARFAKLQIQGSNNGETWITCGELTSSTIQSGVTEYELGAPGEYSYYRLYFENTDSNRVTVKSLSYSLYDIVTYNNFFEVNKGFPGKFTEEQRVLIKTPKNINVTAVIQNTLNSYIINTILQSNKRYELIFNGSAFNAKEI